MFPWEAANLDFSWTEVSKWLSVELIHVFTGYTSCSKKIKTGNFQTELKIWFTTEEQNEVIKLKM